MLLHFEERLSDSPFVERVWRSRSEYAGSFVSLAVSHWEMVVTRHQGKVNFTVRGPETQASRADCPAEGEWVAIRFKMGTVMPHFPAQNLVNGAVTLPNATDSSFWLNGSAWQFPDYENADTFVARLVHDGVLVHEPIVQAALTRQLPALSLRSVQRRFLAATGLTHNTAYQIERARYATNLLRQGVSILDTVDRAGYFDQPHLTRMLRRLIGQTPAQLMNQNGIEQLSFLYNTTPLP